MPKRCRSRKRIGRYRGQSQKLGPVILQPQFDVWNWQVFISGQIPTLKHRGWGIPSVKQWPENI